MFRSIVIAAIIAIAIGAWVISGQVGETKVEAPIEKPPAVVNKAVKVPGVRVRTVRAQEFSDELTLSAITAFDRKTTVSAETGGKLETVSFTEGDRVDIGDVLATIETSTRDAAVRQAEASLNAARADLESTKSLAEKGFISQNRLTSAQANFEAAQAALENAQRSLSDTTITSPVSGLIETKHVQDGSFVGAGAAVATVVATDPLVLKTQASEKDIAQLTVGDSATARLIAGQTYEGRIAHISPVANRSTRTFEVEVEVRNPDSSVIEGMTAEVTFMSKPQMAHLVPNSLLGLSDKGQVGIKLVTAEDTVQFVPVDLLNATPAGFWIEGLPEEIRLITIGQDFVRDGQTVNVTDEAQLAAEVAAEQAKAEAAAASAGETAQAATDTEPDAVEETN